MTRALSAAAAMAVLVASVAGAQRPAVVWASDSTAPCVGLTMAFQADSARVKALVGAKWSAIAGRDGRTGGSLFVTNCMRSTIDGRAAGPVTIAALIVGVSGPADSVGGAPVHAAAVPITYGQRAAPVTELFRSFAFTVRDAAVSMRVDSSDGAPRVVFSIVTADGRIDASAAVVDTATLKVTNSRLLGTDATRPSEFAGPEWSRRSVVAATVRATGRTVLSELGITQMPTAGSYDAGFGWRFAFRMRR